MPCSSYFLVYIIISYIWQWFTFVQKPRFNSFNIWVLTSNGLKLSKADLTEILEYSRTISGHQIAYFYRKYQDRQCNQTRLTFTLYILKLQNFNYQRQSKDMRVNWRFTALGLFTLLSPRKRKVLGQAVMSSNDGLSFPHRCTKELWITSWIYYVKEVFLCDVITMP